MEGGLGDHLLANRFGAAIREKYPMAKIKLYSDTENNPSSSRLLMSLFPEFYDSCQVIEYRKDRNLKINTKFGQEHYPSDISNMPEDVLNDFAKSDKFYDLHIDGLKWLNHDFDWLRYYYFFPRPKKHAEFKNDGFILCHLFSRPDSPYNLDQNYVEELIKNISTISKVVIITTKEHESFYKNVYALKNVEISTPDLNGCFDLAQKCSTFIGIDSGIRYMPYHFSKPTYVFSKYCSQYGSVAPSHLIRWLIFPKNVFPMNFDLQIVSKILLNAISEPVSQLFPEIISGVNNFTVNRFSKL